ncbi:MAG: flavodoxin family protein [Thermoleophilia bacterium]|nr:flavodoxin family protein [Thermoleophilia bacterium]MDH5333897.1 flavodoxin family protein [Thermoleophilia bacterium]
MRSVVVCESWFGNTRQVAQAIADQLARHGEARVVSVADDLDYLEGLDLLVVGAPTHVHGMSSATSRRSAIEQAKETGEREPGPGVRGWLQELPRAEGCAAAAFDTRLEKSVLLVGSAAKGIAKRLGRRGFELVAPAESFFVLDTGGPLEDGELARAAEWAETLAAAVSATAARALAGAAAG